MWWFTIPSNLMNLYSLFMQSAYYNHWLLSRLRCVKWFAVKASVEHKDTQAKAQLLTFSAALVLMPHLAAIMYPGFNEKSCCLQATYCNHATDKNTRVGQNPQRKNRTRAVWKSDCKLLPVYSRLIYDVSTVNIFRMNKVSNSFYTQARLIKN